jgi:hypothetical protein
MLRLGWVFASLLFLFCMSGAYATADHSASRIELNDGTVFTNVKFNIDHARQVIEIDSADVPVVVPYGRIDLILDVAGNDVTRDILGQYYAPRPKPESKSASGIARRKESPRYRRVRLELHSNFAVPLGNYYKSYDAGFGYGGAFSLRLYRRMGVRLMFSRSGVGRSYDKTMVATLGGTTTEIFHSVYDAYEWRASIAIEYASWPREDHSGKTFTYTYLGVGVNSRESTSRWDIWESSPEHEYTLNSSSKSRKLMLQSGSGITIRLSQLIGLNAGLNVETVFPIESADLWAGYVLDLSLGIVIWR